jgi:hypothetical protein
MEDDIEMVGGLHLLKVWTKELVEACADLELLDLVYKLLLNG